MCDCLKWRKSDHKKKQCIKLVDACGHVELRQTGRPWSEPTYTWNQSHVFPKRSRTDVDHVPVLSVTAHRWSPATALSTTRWSFPGERLQPERWRPDGGRCMCPSSGSFHTTSAPSLFFCLIRSLSDALPPSSHLAGCSTDGCCDGYIHPHARREPVLTDCMFLDPSLKFRR